MDQDTLQALVEQISIESFQIPFKHSARFNPRLKTTGGRYLTKSHDIELNPKHYQQFGMDELIGIIKHELCHYHLHLQGKGYHHRDRDFKELMNLVGAPRFCQSVVPVKRPEPPKHFYRCMNCGQRYARKRRVNTSKYRCGFCRGKLEMISVN